MRKYKKNSIEYKIRAWIIVCLGVTGAINSFVAAFNGLVREGTVWMVLEILYTLFCVWAEYDTGVANALVVQSVAWTGSIVCLIGCLSKTSVIAVIIANLIILIIGVYLIINRNYRIDGTKRREKKEKK